MYQHTNLCFCLYLCYRLLIIAWNAKLLWWACLHMVRLERSHSTFDRGEVNTDLRFLWIRYSIMLLWRILLVVPVFVQANSICVWCFKLLICLMFARELGIKWEDFDVIINTDTLVNICIGSLFHDIGSALWYAWIWLRMLNITKCLRLIWQWTPFITNSHWINCIALTNNLWVFYISLSCLLNYIWPVRQHG